MREAWTSRTFAFDFPVERIAVLLSRLRGTTVRIQSAVRGLTPATLTKRQGEGWSIQEHVGHLFELDQLHLQRIDELASGKPDLTAADMSNRATWDANFNQQTFAAVMQAFVTRRAELLKKLSALDAQALGAVGLHPRLQTPMRAVDVAFFAAEHDDNHVSVLEGIAARPQHQAALAR